jgi:hypothetical protein
MMSLSWLDFRRPMPLLHHLTLALVLLSPLVWATEAGELLRDELHEAASREHQELSSRAEELARQVDTAENILQRQQHYIERLEAQLRALQDSQTTPD